MRPLRDWRTETVATLVHHEKCARFSLTPCVDIGDLVFTRDAVRTLLQDATVFHREDQDGNNLPIDLTFEEYCHPYIYDHHFMNVEEIRYGAPVKRGNVTNNIMDYCSKGIVVEYYFSDFEPEGCGMD